MEIKQLKALQTIVNTGSFVDAAESLGITQSALSHQIKSLETELGETLLIRARPRIYPSSGGEAALASANKIVAEVELLEQRFARSKKGPVTGTLRIAATTLSIVHILGDLCVSFIDMYPGIELKFTATESAGAAIKRVLSGAADIAFGPLDFDNEQLNQVVLAHTEHVFIVRDSHPLAQQDSVSVDELRRFPIALFNTGSGTRSLTDDLFLSSGGYPQILTESNDVEFIKRIVSIASASALMVIYALAGQGKAKGLKMLRLNDRRLMAEIGIVHKKNVSMNAIELFKSMCLDLRGPKAASIVVENIDTAPFVS